jgi:hypothetical protein
LAGCADSITEKNGGQEWFPENYDAVSQRAQDDPNYKRKHSDVRIRMTEQATYDIQ